MDEIAMNNNQVHSWGGKREGAGRPVGSTNKERISDYLKDKDKEVLFQKAFELAAAGNDKLLQFFLEQLFGKPLYPHLVSFASLLPGAIRHSACSLSLASGTSAPGACSSSIPSSWVERSTACVLIVPCGLTLVAYPSTSGELERGKDSPRDVVSAFSSDCARKTYKSHCTSIASHCATGPCR